MIACFSLACGTVLFVLIFICQAFFKIYPGAMNLNSLVALDGIFLIAYLTSAYFLVRYKKINKIMLYIAIPFFICLALYVFSDFYNYLCYGSRIVISTSGFFFFYIASGFWALGILSGLIDIILSCIMRKKYSRQL